MPQLDPLEIVAKVSGSEQVENLGDKIKKATDSIEHMGNVVVATSHKAEGGFNDITRASGGMGRGLLQAAYAVDDLQYGFRAVVNNIPMIVAGLGGSAGLAGALGILAVGINQVSNHWQELIDKLSDHSFRVGIEEAQDLTDQLGQLGEKLAEIMGLGGMGAGREGMKWVQQLFRQGDPDVNARIEAAQRRQSQLEDELERAGHGAMGLGTPQQEGQAAAFAKAIKDFGGGKALADEMLKARKDFLGGEVTPAQEEALRREVTSAIGEGMKGLVAPSEAGTIFGKRFGEAYGMRRTSDVMDRAMKEDEESIRKSEREQERKRKERERLTDALNKQGEENEEKLRRDTFEENKTEQRHQIQAQIKAMHQLYEENQDRIRHMGRSEVLSGEEYARQVTQAGFDSIPNQQLKVQKDIKLAIEKLHDKLSKVNEMRFKKE